MKKKKNQKKLLIISIMLTLLLGSGAFVGYRITQSRANSAKAATLYSTLQSPYVLNQNPIMYASNTIAEVRSCKQRIDSIYGPLWKIEIVPTTKEMNKPNVEWDFSMQVVRINSTSPTGSTLPRQIIHNYNKRLVGANKTGETRTIYASLILNDRLEIKTKYRAINENGSYGAWINSKSLIVEKDQYSKILNCTRDY